MSQFLNLSFIFKLQTLYLFLAIAYNMISLFRITLGMEGLAITSPLIGLAVMIFIGCIISLGSFGYLRAYVVLNTLAFTSVFYSGVYTHISNYFSAAWEPLYLNVMALLLAILINAFGVVVAFMGSMAAIIKIKSIS